MKKYASLLLFALLLNGCDDGNITVNTVDFTDVTSASCSDTNELIYKLKAQESLLLQLPANTLTTEPSDIDKPAVFPIDNTNYRLAYRSYDGKVDATNICSLIPPTTPKVIQEWFGKSGQMEITTSQIVTPTTDNGTRITGYNYNIVIKNLTYVLNGVDVTQPVLTFGDFKATLPAEDALPLTFPLAANQCPVSKELYNLIKGGASITIDNVDPNLIVNTPTPLNNPRTALLSQTTNKLVYQTYSGTIDDTYFCGVTPPTTPPIKETWIGDDGVTDVSGIIEVTTESVTQNIFKHTIRLKKVTLRKGNNSFILGDSFLFGELQIITTN